MESISNQTQVSMPQNLPPQLMAAAAAKGMNPSSEQMQDLGTEFESVFLSMMLKEMRQSLDEGFFGSESSDSFGGMFDLFIGQHLAKTGTLGVGDLIASQYGKAKGNDVDLSDSGPTGQVSIQA